MISFAIWEYENVLIETDKNVLTSFIRANVPFNDQLFIVSTHLHKAFKLVFKP